MKKILFLMIAIFVLGSFAGCNIDGNVGNSPGLNGDRNNDGIVDDDILRNDNDDDDLNGLIDNNNRVNNNGVNNNRTNNAVTNNNGVNTNTQRRPANG